MPDDVVMPSQSEANAESGSAEPGSIDAAVEALMKRDTPADEASQEDAEGDDTGTADAKDEADLAEVDYEGERYRLPAKLKDALLRQSDYSRHMQELSTKRQTVEQLEKTYTGAMAKIGDVADAVAAVKMQQTALKEFEGVDWTKLETEDPLGFTVKASKQQQAVSRLREAQGRLQQVVQAVKSAETEGLATKRHEMLKEVAKKIPKWGDEVGTAITQYAKSQGYALEEIGAWTDPRLVVMADKARRFDELQAKRQTIQPAKPGTVVQPGTSRNSHAEVEKTALNKLRQSGSTDAAAAAYLARFGKRR